MTDLLTGIAIALAVVNTALLVWCIIRTLKNEIEHVTLSAAHGEFTRRAMNQWGRHESLLSSMDARITATEKTLEKLAEGQYAESGIYNVVTDHETGKSHYVKAQALEDEWIQQQAGKSPDEILQAAERIMASGRANIHH